MKSLVKSRAIKKKANIKMGGMLIDFSVVLRIPHLGAVQQWS